MGGWIYRYEGAELTCGFVALVIFLYFVTIVRSVYSSIEGLGIRLHICEDPLQFLREKNSLITHAKLHISPAVLLYI